MLKVPVAHGTESNGVRRPPPEQFRQPAFLEVLKVPLVILSERDDERTTVDDEIVFLRAASGRRPEPPYVLRPQVLEKLQNLLNSQRVELLSNEDACARAAHRTPYA
jgi:hypothetical protein